MRKILFLIPLLYALSACWPASVSFVDKGGMPPEWKTFYVTTLENNATNTPLSYSTKLSEMLKDGVQNNSRLILNPKSDLADINIEGVITSYSITPVALQEGDNSAKNRLSVTVQFEIFISTPEESTMKMSSSRFIDYDSGTDLGKVETDLLDEVNNQIVQDVINKLMSNW